MMALRARGYHHNWSIFDRQRRRSFAGTKLDAHDIRPGRMEDATAEMEKVSRRRPFALHGWAAIADGHREPLRGARSEDVAPDDRHSVAFRERLVGVLRIGVAERLEV